MPRMLYVTNLDRAVGDDELERLFAAHGTVRSAEVTKELGAADVTATGLVEMDSDRHAEAAIAALNGAPHRGSPLAVTWAGPGQRQGIDLPHMFDSMNIPGRDERPT